MISFETCSSDFLTVIFLAASFPTKLIELEKQLFISCVFNILREICGIDARLTNIDAFYSSQPELSLLKECFDQISALEGIFSVPYGLLSQQMIFSCRILWRCSIFYCGKGETISWQLHLTHDFSYRTERWLMSKKL